MSFDYKAYELERLWERIAYDKKYSEKLNTLENLLINKFNVFTYLHVMEDANHIPFSLSINILEESPIKNISFIHNMFNKKILDKCQSTYIDLEKYSLEDIYSCLRIC